MDSPPVILWVCRTHSPSLFSFLLLGRPAFSLFLCVCVCVCVKGRGGGRVSYKPEGLALILLLACHNPFLLYYGLPPVGATGEMLGVIAILWVCRTCSPLSLGRPAFSFLFCVCGCWSRVKGKGRGLRVLQARGTCS